MESAASHVPVPLGSVDEWAESALAELSEVPAVSRVGLALVEGGGRSLLFTASDRSATGLDWCHVDAYDDLPLNDAIRSASRLTGSLSDLGRRYATFVTAQREAGFTAIAAVPFTASGRALGGFVLYYDQQQSFTPSHCAELDALADNLAQRLHAARRRPGPPVSDYLPPEGSLFAAHEFPPDPAAVADARRFLRKKLAEWSVDEDTTDNAVLCLSELVTNALIHTHGGCCVQVELHDNVLRTEVHDIGPSAELQVTPAGDWQGPHGRGLQIVDALASRWGRSDQPDRAVAWFALDVP